MASDNTIVIRTKYNNYVKIFLNNLDYSSLNRGSTQPLITQTDIKNQIILFDEKCVSEFENKTSSLSNKIRNNNIENETLIKLRDTLLPKLMNGEIDLEKIEI